MGVMGRDRSGLRKGDRARVAGAFVALPLSVLDSPAYAAASHTDRALLIEIARQCMGDNNGRLLASRAYLAGRGWKSAGVIHRSIQNLLALSLIHQTVQGHHLETPSARQVRSGRAGLKAVKASPGPQVADSAFERVRDCDQDPARFDPISGECLPAVPATPKTSKRAAAAWVTAALREAGKAGAANFAHFADRGQVSGASESDVAQHAES